MQSIPIFYTIIVVEQLLHEEALKLVDEEVDMQRLAQV